MVELPGSRQFDGKVPSMLDALSVLPPAVRIVAGAAMLVTGVVAIARHVDFYSVVLLCLAIALGTPLMLHGIGDARRRRVEAAERARAEAELPELRAALLAARDQQHSVDGVLRQRGYSTPSVRRWIALQCGIVLPTGKR